LIPLSATAVEGKAASTKRMRNIAFGPVKNVVKIDHFYGENATVGMARFYWRKWQNDYKSVILVASINGMAHFLQEMANS
jgi:hypothetical protein